jgi:hypothetical protein
MAIRRGGKSTPVFAVTLDDKALAEARQDVPIGRWQGPRDLLRATGRDWDRRTFRMRVLADAAVGFRCVETWQAAERFNPDAVVLRAEVEVMRVFRLAGAGETVAVDRLDAALRTCLLAADTYPEDPVPWVSLLTLARLYPTGRSEIWNWWAELQARDGFNREAYHQALRYVSPRYHGSDTDMYQFARDVAAAAPTGHPLAALPQVARAEAYRHYVGQGGSRVGLIDHWIAPDAQRDIDRTLQRWIAHRKMPLAQDIADLNYLAHALVYANRLEEAAPIFVELGRHATRVPWTYSGDAEALWIRWRERTLSGGDERSPDRRMAPGR